MCPRHFDLALLNTVEILDNIESNVYSIASDTRGAAEELSTASEHQRKASRRAACLMLIIVFVVALVLIAVSRGFMQFAVLLNLPVFPRSCCHSDSSHFVRYMDLYGEVTAFHIFLEHAWTGRHLQFVSLFLNS